ncbi:TrkH family potassium uptake protein [Kocuria tytonis]|uniref:TrkH family potassium uptake protein n=1 Tax=Kocuria tytonis TaxID=2054280 RepID=A0A495A8K0_9MICC|nr:potassium transporter TrkG [Kocuria tytonis]RKQ36142.1 TrkH family potassium uptake protein [Kocuria tytonis]
MPITEAFQQVTIRARTHGSRIRRSAPMMKSRPDPFHLHELTPARSARLIVSAFLLALLTGTGLLMLPVATVAPGGTDLLTAAFTATSSLCVTGLITVDTATYWTPFGQVVIIFLIQVGGLGVMTFTTTLGILLARKFGLSTRLLANAETKSRGGARQVVARIVLTTAVIESSAAAVLFLRFLLHYHYPPSRALAHGAFHAVSAFNNAGFALYSLNVVDFAGDPVVLLTLSTCVILGGLGFPVLYELRRHICVPRRWSMNTRLVLLATPVLLVSGTVFLLVLEWNNPATLGPQPAAGKLLNAFFQSTISRTAGFNSIDISHMHPVSWLGMDILMFIGGGPAGTAGGLKVTTFGVLFFIALTEIRGGAAVPVLGKQLSRSVQREAITVVVLATGAVIGGTMLIMLTDTTLGLDRVLYEAVSAFSTVGLSTGITPTLAPFAQCVLIALMFMGRLGPVTVSAAIAFGRRPPTYELPKERPLIG